MAVDSDGRHAYAICELDSTMAALARHLARHCVLLHPFMPGKTMELWRALGAPGTPGEQRFTALPELDANGWKVTKPAPLFPKEAPAKEAPAR